VERVLELYRERYFDLNVKHFHEELKPEHQIEVSYTWLKLVLQGAWVGELQGEDQIQITPSWTQKRCRARPTIFSTYVLLFFNSS
jgi:hypothetical protein